MAPRPTWPMASSKAEKEPMKKRMLIVAAVAALLALPSCSGLTDEQELAMKVDELLQKKAAIGKELARIGESLAKAEKK